MAKMTIKTPKELTLQLNQLSDQIPNIAEKALRAGANILADTIRQNLNALPEDRFRKLSDGESFVGVPERQKKDLQDSLGITPVKIDRKGYYNLKVGFDGYGSYPTKKYPKGLPNQLLARSIESGSSVRQKTPFVGPAVKNAKKAVLQAMQEEANLEIEKITK